MYTDWVLVYLDLYNLCTHTCVLITTGIVYLYSYSCCNCTQTAGLPKALYKQSCGHIYICGHINTTSIHTNFKVVMSSLAESYRTIMFVGGRDVTSFPFLKFDRELIRKINRSVYTMCSYVCYILDIWIDYLVRLLHCIFVGCTHVGYRKATLSALNRTFLPKYTWALSENMWKKFMIKILV